MNKLIRACILPVLLILLAFNSWAKGDDFPEPSNPPRLVNDMAGMLSSIEEERLEHKLVGFDNTTSTQITIVTLKSIGGYDVADYTVKLFNKWGIGQKGKNNGVLVLIAKDERKAWITTGKGLEGVLTDAQTARIYRNELKPAFKQGDYYGGLDRTADAIIAVTKGEYKAEAKNVEKGAPIAGIIILIIIIAIISSRRGGGGGGYMSRRGGLGDIATGMLISSLLNGGRRHGGGWGGGGSDWGGGGFGGFGGGSSGGGGAGGSW